MSSTIIKEPTFYTKLMWRQSMPYMKTPDVGDLRSECIEQFEYSYAFIFISHTI